MICKAGEIYLRGRLFQHGIQRLRLTAGGHFGVPSCPPATAMLWQYHFLVSLFETGFLTGQGSASEPVEKRR